MISVADEGRDQSPDDLMDIPIGQLALKLTQRVRRLKKLKKLNAPPCCIRKEKHLIRVAETAARARVREMSDLLVQLMDQ